MDPIKSNSLTIAVDALDKLYYANAFSGLNFISRIAISSSQILSDPTVRITVNGANGSLTKSLELEVGSIGAAPVVFDQLDLSFDSNKLFQISDAQPGEIHVEVFTGDVSQGFAKWPIEVLPANFWQFRDEWSRSAYLSLAAFSQPNHPSISKILKDAAEIMKTAGHPEGIAGYQSSKAVEPMAKAIFESIQNIGITYSEPPASWSRGPGQKIRTTQEMLDEGLGTCLDTTMLLSSCLEQAGLFPLVFLIPGHAFVGYWTAKAHYEADGSIPRLPPVSSIDSLANHIESGWITLIETTKLTSTSTFQQASQAASVRLDSVGAYGVNAASSVAIDILACRKADHPVNPLPARFVDDNGNVEIHEYKPPVVDMDMLKKKFAERDAVDGNTIMLNVPVQVRKWLDSLLDLSLRNPLISFGNRRSATRLLIPKKSLGIVEDLLQSQKIFQLAPAPSGKGKDGKFAPIHDDNSRGEVPDNEVVVNFLNSGIASTNGVIFTDHRSAEAFVARMRRTASEAKSIQQETGSNGLYLALGSLTWKVKQGEIESPLVLIPVTLTPKNRGAAFALSIEESGVTPNFSLVEKLKIEHKINLSGLAELKTDKFGIDIDGTLNYVRDTLIKEGLQDFRVNATATLGFFNFSSYRLWKDLLDNWKRFDKNPLVHHLIESSGEAFVDPAGDLEPVDLDKLMAELPISADGSQAVAIASAIQGKTFVLQGPPGTGKSQTITNLLARALDEGKRVLFVAEKRDALDVVRERINEVGLGAFSLDLHDKNSTSKAVKAQLAEVLDILIEPDKVGFDAALEDYTAALVPLNNYKSQLHDVSNFGESVFSSMEKYLATASEFTITVPGEYIASSTEEAIEDASMAIKSIASLGASAGTAETNPWSLSDRSNAMEPAEHAALSDLLLAIDANLTRLERQPLLKDYISKASLSQLKDLAALRVEGISQALLTTMASTDSSEQLEKAAKTLAELEERSRPFPFDPSRVGKIDFGSLENQLQIATSAGFLTRGMKISKVATQLNALLGAKGLIAKADLASSLEKLDALRVAGNKASSIVQGIPALEDFFEINLFDSDARGRASKRLGELKIVNSFISDSPLNQEAASRLLSSETLETKDEVSEFLAQLDNLLNSVSASDESIRRWAKGSTFGQRLLSSRSLLLKDAREFGSSQLIRWTAIQSEGRALRENGLGSVFEDVISGEFSYETANNAFLKGFYEALFSNLIVKQGLNTIDGSSVDNQIRKLTDAHERLRIRLPRVLGSELLSRRGFDGSMRIGAIGDLMLSIKQGKSNVPLREMLSKHWDVISQITPCVLASPDSAVRFLSAGFEPFDLVVFDEASQIRVANSIGSLGRAKAAIIVGDSQQMPPTSVAQAKTSSEDEDQATEEMEENFGTPESILDQCELARVPEIMLTWHYRSEDESLIAFSNKEYYKGKLSTFPTPSLDQSSRRISLEVLQGQFIRSASDKSSRNQGQLRTNPVEAEAIVRDVIRRLNDESLKHESIAIVTLNEQQKQLIESLLTQSLDEALQTALEAGINGEEILIKPLEKVQGSERDVVLISIAFSPKKEDPQTLPLNFGPIRNQGGHRRLNVAITRARKEVKVFSSFEPKMLLDRDPTARGLVDLANFLAMAKANSADVFEKLSAREARLDWHRQDVASRLRQAGYLVHEDVGLSDFKVDLAIADPASPGKAVLGILLDGQRWRQRATVSDRDSLPTNMLTNRMGWAAVERIWLPNWIRDKSGEISRIEDAFSKAKNKPAQSRPKIQSKDPAAPIFTKKSDLEDQDRYQGVNPFDALLSSVPVWSELGSRVLGGQEILDRLHDSSVRRAIAEIVGQLTEHEGPVSPKRLAKFVGSCFDFSRMVPSRIHAINGVPLPGHHRDDEQFVYPSGVKSDRYDNWRRAVPGNARPLEEISLVEIGNAMKSISKVAQGVEQESLIRETSRVFGVQKLSKDGRRRLEQALAGCLESGSLVSSDGYLKIQ